MTYYHTRDVREFVYGQLAPRWDGAILLTACLTLEKPSSEIYDLLWRGGRLIPTGGLAEEGEMGGRDWMMRKDLWDRRVASEVLSRLACFGVMISKPWCGAAHFLVWCNLIKQKWMGPSSLEHPFALRNLARLLFSLLCVLTLSLVGCPVYLS